MKNFHGLGSATLIGSMPQRDRESAIGLVLEAAPEIPAWPQLPAYPAERMMAQYIEGLPGLVSEEDGQSVRPDSPEFERQTLAFYEQYLAVGEGSLALDDSRFRMGEQTGASLRCFLETLRRLRPPLRAVKGQTVGPFTLLSGLKDQDGRALIYDERFLDIIPKLLGLKARWQVDLLGTFGVPVIVFLDEPALAGFGSSAFITVSAEAVLGMLAEVVEAVHTAGGLAGIHVCANTDWLLAFRSNLDIINFDAYEYFDKFALYRKELFDFLGRGGNIAWGVVPTSDTEAIYAQTPESLAAMWAGRVRELAAGETDIKEIIAHSLFTPACGCASLPEDCAARVFDLLKGFCSIIRAGTY